MPTAFASITAVLFYLFAAVVAAGAIGVVASRNIVRTAVYLLFALAGIAGIYFLLDAEFLAAVQLVIYVGGTLILIIFGVMLTNKSPAVHFEPTRTEAIAALVIGVVLLSALILALIQLPAPPAAEQTYSVAALGAALLGDFLIPFELASVVLLVVMIGAAYLAKRRKTH
jgi:NADH-quinone oxidoreductase subunit J